MEQKKRPLPQSHSLPSSFNFGDEPRFSLCVKPLKLFDGYLPPGRHLVEVRVLARGPDDPGDGLPGYRAGSGMAVHLREGATTRVDAVLGRKQALETEVQNLALGRYPLSLLRELAEAGMLHESNEYWPFDGEHWPDEYE